MQQDNTVVAAAAAAGFTTRTFTGRHNKTGEIKPSQNRLAFKSPSFQKHTQRSWHTWKHTWWLYWHALLLMLCFFFFFSYYQVVSLFPLRCPICHARMLDANINTCPHTRPFLMISRTCTSAAVLINTRRRYVGTNQKHCHFIKMKVTSFLDWDGGVCYKDIT